MLNISAIQKLEDEVRRLKSFRLDNRNPPPIEFNFCINHITSLIADIQTVVLNNYYNHTPTVMPPSHNNNKGGYPSTPRKP